MSQGLGVAAGAIGSLDGMHSEALLALRRMQMLAAPPLMYTHAPGPLPKCSPSKSCTTVHLLG